MEKRIVLFILLLSGSLLVAQVIAEGFETGDFSAYDWQFSGDAEWLVTDNFPYEGEYCAQGGNIGDNQTTTLEIDINCPESGILSFVWKVSSEENYDFFRFYLDDTMLAQIHGTTGWTLLGYGLTAGEHNLRWSYVKDYSVSNGSDTGWLDNVNFFIEEEEFNYDLEIVNMAGPEQLTGGNSYTYDVTVRNNGFFSFTGYTVSLVDSSGNEYASETTFWMLPSGDENTVELTIEPAIDFPDTVTGLFAYGEVANDENPLNDYSERQDVHIIPADHQFALIGEEESLTNYLPLSFIWKTSMTETIYYADELPAEGNLCSIDFFNNFWEEYDDISIRIWLGATENQSLTEGWINADSLQLVYDGTADFAAGENIINLQLDTPFSYQGGNLVMLIERCLDPVNHTWSSFFYYSELPGEETGRTRYNYSDLYSFDTSDLSGGILCDWVANTAFIFAPLTADDENILLPTNSLFGKIYPNPFYTGKSRQSVSIEVLAEKGLLSIYDIKGRKVNEIPVNNSGFVHWNGCNYLGKQAASGIYLLQFKTSNHTDNAQLLLLK